MNTKEIQQALINLGFSVGPGLADGKMGPFTERAILSFQRAFHLTPDGIAGEQTQAALIKSAASDQQPPSLTGWMQLIDVSRYQGKIDFVEAKAAGISAVAIKATEGDSIVDPMFHENWAAAKAAGLPRLAYHFLNNQRGFSQAKFFLNTLGDDPGEITPMLDWEQDVGIPIADDWLVCVEDEGAKFASPPFVYSYSSFLSCMYLTKYFADHPLWLAGYVAQSQLVIPPPWTNFAVWQYRSGLGGATWDSTANDFDKFPGTIEQFLVRFGKKDEKKAT